MTLAIFVVLGFAACSAALDEEGIFDDWNDIGGNYAPMEPEVDAEDEVIEDEAGDVDVQNPSFVENPFISTQENNLSTFSSDVDTAS